MYNRLFTKILDSSIWLHDSPTRIVWITLLAAMDQDGYVHFSAIENLASRARVTLDEAKKAVLVLSSPDEESGDGDNDGRRIERVPGGFIVLNAAKYKALVNRAVDREQTRLRVAKHRNASVTDGNASVTDGNASVTDGNASVTEVALQRQREQTRLRVAKYRRNKKCNASVTDSNGIVTIQRQRHNTDPDLITHHSNGESPQLVTVDTCPHQKIIGLYHEILPMCPVVRVWHEQRRKHLKARWTEHPSLEWWAGYFKHVARSRFLTGMTNGADDRAPFVASLEWLIKRSNLTKVYEGNYDD